MPLTLALTLRYAMRAILRDRASSLLAMAVLALGIAGTTVTYSAVEAVILRSLPFRDPARLVDIRQTMRERRAGSIGGGTNSLMSFETVRAQRDVFEDVAAHMSENPILSGAGDGVERIKTWHVTANYFPLLGVAPLIGRGFTPEEDRQGSASTIVLSHGFWMSRFGGDPRVVGRTLTLDGRPAEVVGVMPRGFNYPRDTVLWRSMGSAARTSIGHAGRESAPQGSLWIVGRLRPGMEVPGALARLDAAWADLGRQHKRYNGWVCNLTPLHTSLIGTASRPLWLLFGAALLVLAIACANVANLLLVRAMAREQEVAVRLALGAGRARIVSQFLAESLLIASAGGAAGVILAAWSITWLRAMGGRDVARLADVALNPQVLGWSVAATLATGFLFGLVPGLWAAARRAYPGARAGVTRWKPRIGDVSLVGQLAVTVVLLGAAGLVTLSVLRLMRVETGYDSTGVIAAHLWLPMERYASPAQMTTFASQVEERLHASGALAGGAVGSGMPFEIGIIASVRVDDEPERKGRPDTFVTSVSADYFGVLQIPLRRGRALRFDGSDADAILINESLAREYFPGRDPIGRRVHAAGERDAVVVGIVADTRDYQLVKAPGPHIYRPFAAHPAPYVRIVVRARSQGGDMTAAAAALRDAVRQVDRGVPIDKLITLREMMLDSIVRQRLVMTLLIVFAGLALVMSASGTYALLAHQVARRRRELGIRIALGAEAGRILTIVVGRGVGFAAVGVLIGVGGAAAAGRVLSAFLFDVSPYDPLVLGAVAVVLVATVLLACWAPARRAARIDPAALLRAE